MSVNRGTKTSYGLNEPLVTQNSNPIIAQRDPGSQDKASLGTIWINRLTNSSFILTSGSHWNLFTLSSGSVSGLISNDMTVAFPLNGVIGIMGGANVVTTTSANTIDINLTQDISIGGMLNVGTTVNLPNTNSAGLAGVIRFGGQEWISNRGLNNSFVGDRAGNTILDVPTVHDNTAFGFLALHAVTINSSFNIAIGSGALEFLEQENDNIGIGYNSLNALTNGGNNIAIGSLSGIAYSTTESDNITIGNIGITGESNVLRIGSSANINNTYVAGIYNSSLGTVAGVVQADSVGKLASSNGTDGQLLIAAATTKPSWGNIVSNDGSLTITYDGTNINIEIT